jgi:hypothetical protein
VEDKKASGHSSEDRPAMSATTREDIEADKRALRVLLASFHVEQETLLEETLDDPRTRRKIGTFIGHTMVKPYWGEH